MPTQTKMATKDLLLRSLAALPSPSLQPTTPGTFLISGGSVAFQGTRTFVVAPATYVIDGVQYTAAGASVTVGASDPSNPRFDAIVLDTSGVISVIAGVAASTPALPDIDQQLYLALTYIQIAAAAGSVDIVTTDLYRENVEWTSSVSGGTMNAASTSTPRTGSKCIQGTAAVANDYVRLTNSGPVSLSGQDSLVLYVNPSAAWPNTKSLQVGWFLSGTKVGQTVAVNHNTSGFNVASATYQQIVIPIKAFGTPANSLVDRLQIQVSGGGAAIGFRIDDIYLQGVSPATTPPIYTTLQAEVDAVKIRTVLISIEGGGVVITTGIKQDYPFDFGGKILGWKLLGDQSGSIQIDLWKADYSVFPPTVTNTITASAKPLISAATKNKSTALTGWTTSFNEGDIVRVNVDSCTSITRAVLALKCQVI